MKRIQRGPVRGISFRLQEEERERKDQFVPEVSALDFTQNSESGMLDVDQETKDLLKSMGVSTAASLQSCCNANMDDTVRQHPSQRRGCAATAGHREASPLRRQASSGLSVSHHAMMAVLIRRHTQAHHLQRMAGVRYGFNVAYMECKCFAPQPVSPSLTPAGLTMRLDCQSHSLPPRSHLWTYSHLAPQLTVYRRISL